MKRLLVALGLVFSITLGVGVGAAIREPALSNAQRDAQLTQDQLAIAKASASQALKDSAVITATFDTQAAQLSALQQQLNASAQRLTDAQKQIERLSIQQQQAAPVPGLADLAAQLKADQQLLIESRRDTPDNRDDARRQWATVKALAVVADPALGQQVDRITRVIPVYYNWREQKFPNVQAAQIAYVGAGASAYQSAIDSFWKAFYLVASDHLAVLAKIPLK